MAEEIAGKTVQVLDLMLKYFATEQHWLKNNYHDGGSRRCLVGAALHFSAKLGLPGTPVMSLLEAALPQRQMGLVSFNDRCRSINNLRAVIHKARAFALKDTEHERAAAAFQRRFLAELEQERGAQRAAGDSRATFVLCPRAPRRLAA